LRQIGNSGGDMVQDSECSVIKFLLNDGRWSARIENFEIELELPIGGVDEIGGSFALNSYALEIEVPCEADGCPDESMDKYDVDPDACVDGCPFKKEVDSIDSSDFYSGGVSVSELRSSFQEHIRSEKDGFGNDKKWCSNAQMFAKSNWLIGTQVLTAYSSGLEK